MMRLFPTYSNRKQLSLKQFLLAFFICASVATWMGITAIQAEEVDPGDYVENNEVDFQNAAQERHAKNLAIKAVLQNSKLMEQISNAKANGDDEAARTQFREAVEDYMEEISEKRAEGEGWGNIAKYYGVDPKYLGLGHFKKKKALAGQNYSNQNKDRGLALGHGKQKSGIHGVGHGGGNGHGNGGANRGDHGGGKK